MKPGFPKFGLFHRAGPLIGVDVGSSSIKLAQTALDGPRWSVAAAGVIPAGGPDSAEEAPDRIREFLKDRRVPRPWRAAAALPGQESEIRVLNLQAGDASTLSQRVMSAAERVLPFGTEDTILDFFPLGRSFEGGEKTERVLLAAASRRSVDRRLAFLERAGMIPEVIELIPWSLARAVRRFGIGPEDAPFGVLDLGHSTSTIIIFEKQGLFLSRSVRAGSKILTEKVRKELDLDWNRAEQLKGERGLSLAAHACRTGGRDEGGTLVAEILDDLFLPTLAHLADEVEKSVGFYASETQGETLDRLILAGGGARLRNLDVFLAERLGLPVRILSPEPAGSDSEAPGTHPGLSWPLMATALGLSMRGLEAPSRKLRNA